MSTSFALQHKKNRLYYALLAGAGLVVLLALYAVDLMEEKGHIITGMNNQIVWGMPHVFAIFLIVAASGVLNVASIGSVFGKAIYKARAPLAGLLSIAMLSGGLAVLMLDLGRPERFMLPALDFNITSVFAWNTILYSGMFGLVIAYLWSMFEKRMNVYSKPLGVAVFAWRFILTTGTGLIFAFLTARQAFGSAILPPMFVVMSFAWGMAVFHIVQMVIYAWNDKELEPEILERKKRLLGLFILGSLYMVAVYHMTNLYFAHRMSFERFILLDGGVYPALFWWGYVLIGNVLPLALIFMPGMKTKKSAMMASLAVVLGGFAFLYVFIIGGQAFPLELFPGYQVSSTFGDGQIGSYTPSIYEILLGFGGLAIAFIITTVSVHVLNFMPHDKSYIAD